MPASSSGRPCRRLPLLHLLLLLLVSLLQLLCLLGVSLLHLLFRALIGILLR